VSLQNNHPLLIVISGPTAVGKTELSIALAETYSSPIISADSRQIYKEMPIGTAQPEKDTLERVPHHFIASHSIHDEFTAGDFEREAMQVLAKHYGENRVAFVVGGTLFYIRALVDGLDPFPPISSSIRREVDRDMEEKGLNALQEELKRADPKSFTEIDIQNPRRLSRALMVIRQSGQSFSSFKQNRPLERPFRPVFIQLDRPREAIYDRINQRVDEMVAQGLENEARSLYPHRHLKACDTVGYKEWFRYFDGDWSKEKAIEKIKQHTRNYAKRQLTWFRKEADRWHRFGPDQGEEILEFLKDKVRKG